MLFEEAKEETEEDIVKRQTFIRRVTTVLFFAHVYLTPACWIHEGKDSPVTVLACMMTFFYAVTAIAYHHKEMKRKEEVKG